MRKITLLSLLFFALSCTQKPSELIGIWEVKTPYHQAIYSIEESNNNIIGKIKYYNDHTYIYQESGTSKDIFLHKLKRKDSLYIDAISGATTTNQEWVIQRKHTDTLLVTQYIHNQPLLEVWIKKK
jgi:hypothetical protein